MTYASVVTRSIAKHKEGIEATSMSSPTIAVTAAVTVAPTKSWASIARGGKQPNVSQAACFGMKVLGKHARLAAPIVAPAPVRSVEAVVEPTVAIQETAPVATTTKRPWASVVRDGKQTDASRDAFSGMKVLGPVDPAPAPIAVLSLAEPIKEATIEPTTTADEPFTTVTKRSWRLKDKTAQARPAPAPAPVTAPSAAVRNMTLADFIIGPITKRNHKLAAEPTAIQPTTIEHTTTKDTTAEHTTIEHTTIEHTTTKNTTTNEPTKQSDTSAQPISNLDELTATVVEELSDVDDAVSITTEETRDVPEARPDASERCMSIYKPLKNDARDVPAETSTTTECAETPPVSPTHGSPLKRTCSNDSTPSHQQLVSSDEWCFQPERTDHLPSAAFNQRQKDLVAACWNLDPEAVHHVLRQSNGAQVYLNGLSEYHGNTPLQVAVDSLIHHVDHLRATRPEDCGAREHTRKCFYWVMMLLIERMEMPELQNTNYQAERYHALGKLAHWAGDWRLLTPLMEAMTRMSGAYPTTFQYMHGATWNKDDTHVVGSLVERFQLRVADPDLDPTGVVATREFQWHHPVGRFVR